MAKAFSYVRMSTEVQLKGDSLRRQLELSKKYADDHGLELDQEFNLRDIGVPAFRGQNIETGSFGRFLDAVKEGKIPTGSFLLVESFDRMSRQAPSKALQPFLEIINKGITLVTMRPLETFDAENLDFMKLLYVLTLMQRGHEESATKSARLGAAWSQKRKQIGEKKLTARCPSWLKLSADRQSFEIIEDRAAVVRRMFDHAIAGLGAYTIVGRLNIDNVPTFTGKGGWQTSTVNKVISSPAVIGDFQPSRMVGGKRQPTGELQRGYFPRIISDEKFYAAQRGRLGRRTTPVGEVRGSGGRKGKHFANLFSKLAICAYCKKPMQYENKGAPPKGGTYLVCSSALRKLDCHMTGRWRYDHFEAAVLSFVEQLDLGSLVSSEKYSSKRGELVGELDTLDGKQKSLNHELEVAYQTSVSLGDHTSDFLVNKIKECEAKIATIKNRVEVVAHELSNLDETALTYYARPDEVSSLIEQVRSTRGEGVYLLRAKIASRLQALIKKLTLDIPDGPVDADGYAATQEFSVTFHDDHTLMLFVDPADPKKVKQISRSDGKIVRLTDELGNVETIDLENA